MVLELPPLAILVFWVGALIFCLLCLYITKALFKAGSSAFGWIPGVGGWIKGELHTIEQRIVSVMSDAVAKCDAEIGAAWHRLARLVDWIGREINAHANLLALIAQFIPQLAPVAYVRMWIGELRALIRAAQRLVTQVQTHAVTAAKAVSRTVTVDVVPRVRAVERKVGNVIAHDLPRLRAADRTLTRDVTALGKWVRAHALVAGSLAFAGAVAVALGRLGLGWTRCSKVGQAGKNLCGMDAGLLESLLADSLLVVGSLSLVEFAHEMVGVTDLAVRPITDFWRAS